VDEYTHYITHLSYHELSRNLSRVCDGGPALSFRSFIQLHLLSEAFWPSLQQSLPVLGWGGYSGRIEDYQLKGPLYAELAAHTNLPEWLCEYDLVSPVTAFALPKLRQSFSPWMIDRGYRSIFLIPFQLGQEPESWRAELKSMSRSSLFRLKSVMLFMPNPAHYEWIFSDHTKDEWASGAASALWNLQTGTVVYADGIHTEQSLQDCGQPLERWMKLPEPGDLT
jgi:hypothetical protein